VSNVRSVKCTASPPDDAAMVMVRLVAGVETVVGLERLDLGLKA
jgi:hypothetical protein